jgi:HSP20 family protein
MTLMRPNPYDTFENLDRTMSRMIGRMRAMMNDALMLSPYEAPLMQRDDANLLAVDMTSDDKHIIVRTALPGFKEEEIDVSVRGNILTISAESKAERTTEQANWHIRELRYGKFTRSVVLPEDIFFDKADAVLEDGILTVKLPKQKPNPIQRIVVKARNLLKSGQR